MNSTKDNWIKAFDEKFPYNGCIFEDDGRSYNFDDIKSFISQVEKDAKSESYTNGFREGFDAGVEKTNKRWRDKCRLLKLGRETLPDEADYEQEQIIGYNKALKDLLGEET